MRSRELDWHRSLTRKATAPQGFGIRNVGGDWMKHLYRLGRAGGFDRSLTLRPQLEAIDAQMHDWAADTFDSDEQDRAREMLRRIVVRLGDVARDGAADPRERIAPVVDRVLDLRKQMRTEGQYALADRLRDLLVDAGIEVRDSPDGSTWHLGDA